MSDMDNFDAVRNGMAAGASIVFPKGNPIPELTSAIQSVLHSRRIVTNGGCRFEPIQQRPNPVRS